MLIPFACNNSKQSELPSPQKTNTAIRNTKSAAILGTAAHNFVNTFYNSVSYTVGRQVTTLDGTDTYIVSEITLSGESRARGYIVTNQTNNAPLYFADVDRRGYNMTSVDIAKNETLVSTNLNQSALYNNSDEFDFIKIILEDDPIEREGRKFWGWTGWEYGPCENGRRFAMRVHYVFWSHNKTLFQTGVGCDQTLSNDFFGGPGSFTLY